VIINKRKEESKHMYFGIQSYFEEYLMEEGLEERMEHVTTSDQMLDSCRRETIEIGFSLMAPTSVFSPSDLVKHTF
jgi:hypothetical protein